MLLKRLGAIALGTVSVLGGASEASAGIFRCSSSAPTYCVPVPCTSVHVIPPATPPVAPPHLDEAVRQVRVTYFSTKYSAWFESDAVVSQTYAAIGLSVDVNVPGVGHVRGWVVTVYTQPRTQSPYGTQIQEAVKAPSGVSVKTDDSVRALVSTPRETERLAGCTRLWTNNAGTKHVVAELVKVNEDSITVRATDGRVVKQPLDSLSEADVQFIRTSSEASPLATQVN